jgi:methylenetetrahydrofolate dehydrogenase (NADP+)/methenyltetrahydrofolate cyclohydrolase
MKVSGKEVAEAILKKLALKIQENNLKPGLAIILANENPASRIYVTNKIKTAQKVGVDAKLYEFTQDQEDELLEKLEQLNNDLSVHGIIIQYPVYSSWNFKELEAKINLQKDVDGFLENSPFSGATALAIWEMLTAFSLTEGFLTTEQFLKDKNIVVVGQGKTAGGPFVKLLKEKGFDPKVVVKETENPDEIIKSGDIVVSATGVKNIISKDNLKEGSFVIGVGVGKEKIDGEDKIYGDLKEDEVSQIAKLYCPTIGGIGPLTIVSLLENVVESAKKEKV